MKIDQEDQEVWYVGYEKEPIGGGNPYYQCVGCGSAEPQINGSLKGHGQDCPEVQRYYDEKRKSDERQSW